MARCVARLRWKGQAVQVTIGSASPVRSHRQSAKCRRDEAATANITDGARAGRTAPPRPPAGAASELASPGIRAQVGASGDAAAA